MEQPKDNKGRFLTNKQKQELIEIEISDNDYINQVKTEIYSLHYDADRIRKAYQLIIGIENGNAVIMKKTILAYSKN